MPYTHPIKHRINGKKNSSQTILVPLKYSSFSRINSKRINMYEAI